MAMAMRRDAEHVARGEALPIPKNPSFGFPSPLRHETEARARENTSK